MEGDSALTSCKLARNAEFQAIIPVRGKPLNCLKATYDKILANEIITDLITILGCGIEMGGKGKSAKAGQTYNREALRWSKIIICTDADEDGYQIRTLILTMLFRLLPSLIREGRVFIAQTPLYEITCKTETYLAYDEREKNEILLTLGNAKYTLQRSKGLGENDAKMMSSTTMNPSSRRLMQITMEDEAKTYEMFDILLGDNIAARKEFISENGAKYLPYADI